MEFLVFTYVGIAAALLHTLLPGEHRVGVASALVVGVAGAWSGALFASAFVKGGWAAFGWLALGGSIIGSIGCITLLELIADRYAHTGSSGWGE